VNSNSKDYHDYVFRDGKLVDEFEAMYVHSEAVPWHQDEQANWVDIRLTGELLSDIGPFDEIHDLGCGLGHYLGFIGERVGAGNCQCFGYDISETACRKAKQQFPNFQFMTLDLTAPTSHKPQATSHKPQASIVHYSWDSLVRISKVRYRDKGNRRFDEPWRYVVGCPKFPAIGKFIHRQRRASQPSCAHCTFCTRILAGATHLV